MSGTAPAFAEPPVCPLFGLAGDPATHFTFPTAGHRCHATGRPAPIELAHQGSLCLSATYPDCVLFTQAIAAGRVRAPSAEPWLLVAPASGTIATVGAGTAFAARTGLAASPQTRRRTPGSVPPALRILAGVVALAVIAALLVLASFSWHLAGSAGKSPVSGASPNPSASMAPSASPSASAGASAGATGSGSPAPSNQPPPTPGPSPITTNRTHIVAFGETLSSIATRYGVTLKALEVANHITDPNVIHVGERLIIPPP